MNYKLIKNYHQDDTLRKSFHELTQKTFGFQLEEWYQNGYWKDSYIPYSLVEGDKIVSNVSVNLMDITINGYRKNFIQLGTVMTDEAYRKQGLGRYIMEEVLREYKDKTDGIYLYANDSATDFYPKFGFVKSNEYRYRKFIESGLSVQKAIKADMNIQEEKAKVLETLRDMAVNNNVHMDNYGLYTFYLTGFMKDQIYFIENQEALAVAEIDGEILYLNQIFAKKTVNLDEIIRAFGEEIKEVVLGFVPIDTSGYLVEAHREADCTFYVMGEELKVIEQQRLKFPVLSHA